MVEEGRLLRLVKRVTVEGFRGGKGGELLISAFPQEVLVGCFHCFSSLNKDYSSDNQGCSISQILSVVFHEMPLVIIFQLSRNPERFCLGEGDKDNGDCMQHCSIQVTTVTSRPASCTTVPSVCSTSSPGAVRMWKASRAEGIRTSDSWLRQLEMTS